MSVDKRRIHKLSNQLTLLGEPNSLNKSCGLGFFVRTGARDEFAKESGISHFLEHMMFKGTAKRSSLDITYQLGNIGAQSNAYTSEEHTVYYAVILPEFFATMQELLSDMIRPALDPQEFSMEKKVILEEIALYKDRPHYFLFEKAVRDYFSTHAAGNSVLGTTESVAAISVEEMRAYYDRRYSPSNMVLVATGDFSWDTFVADAEKYCGSWADKPVSREVSDYVPQSAIKREYRKKNLNQAHLMLMARGCSAQAEERYALTLLSTIIGDSSGSKMYWELVDTGLAESADCSSDEKDGTGCLVASASTEPQNIDKVSQLMFKILAASRDFSEADVERAKNKLISRIVLSGELPIGRLMAIGGDWHYRHKFESLQEIIARLKEVTRAEILTALDRYQLDSWSEFRLLPE